VWLRCARFLAVVCTVLAPLSLQANDRQQDVRAAVDAAIVPLLAKYEIPGMAVAVTLDGRPYIFTYGVASNESKTPVTEATLFEIGSVSKVFTSTLVGFAVATGKLSLDDHPGKYIPELKGSAIDRATILHLGTYTAGDLPLQFPDEVETNAAVIAYFRAWKPIDPPGVARHYSNPSLGLFGLAAARAMGEPFRQAMETHIFQGLQMSNTFIHVPEEKMPHYAWGYRDAKAVRVTPGPLDQQAYGVKTTAPDLLRFVQANIQLSGLDAPLRQAIAATQVGYFHVPPMVQGIGWEQYNFPVSREWLLGGNSTEMALSRQPAHRIDPQSATGARWFNKTGSTNGFGAYVAFVPSKRIGIVMLANRAYPNPARIEAAFRIVQQLTPDSR
jgi:beta-lactamase class C